jgi:hypothetical protein
MKKHSMMTWARRSMALGAIALATAFAATGCAVDTGSGDEGQDIDLSEAQETKPQSSCCWGVYLCPTDNMDFGYSNSPSSCGGDPLRTVAYSGCEKYCSVTCKDSGWHCGTVP